MAQVPAQAFYNGPFAVYTSPTGMTDPITGLPELGGYMHEGDYCDLTEKEARQWDIRYGSKLNTGRYRLVRLSTAALTANIAYGKPVGWGIPNHVGQVAISAPGTGTGTGTVACASTTANGSIAAVALVTVSSGVIVGVQLANPGANMTATPTFPLTELAAAGITTTGTVVAQMAVSPNFIG